MLYLLRILSYMQKGKTEMIIDLIEKILLESYPAQKIANIRPLFDFVYFTFFKLIEYYDYFKLVEIFGKLIKNTIGCEPSVIETLMIIL
jgi:hypothetical protein